MYGDNPRPSTESWAISGVYRIVDQTLYGVVTQSSYQPLMRCCMGGCMGGCMGHYMVILGILSFS